MIQNHFAVSGNLGEVAAKVRFYNDKSLFSISIIMNMFWFYNVDLVADSLLVIK